MKQETCTKSNVKEYHGSIKKKTAPLDKSTAVALEVSLRNWTRNENATNPASSTKTNT
jgi:hypothetical protein